MLKFITIYLTKSRDILEEIAIHAQHSRYQYCCWISLIHLLMSAIHYIKVDIAHTHDTRELTHKDSYDTEGLS